MTTSTRAPTSARSSGGSPTASRTRPSSSRARRTNWPPTTPPHHLHGGKKGWDKVVWTAEPRETPKGPALRLTHVSPDGEEGYPGTVTATATYTLTNDGELYVEMEASTDKTTLVNMAHHSYWNLAGVGSGTILEHELQIDADQYTAGRTGPRRKDHVGQRHAVRLHDRQDDRARPSRRRAASRSASITTGSSTATHTRCAAWRASKTRSRGA